jgi:UDP-N-acetylglucosamine 1-carboxyvinyltransferase
LDKFVIRGGNRLEGRVRVGGSKNATLAILGAALVGQDEITLRNVPDIGDIATMFDLLTALGCRVSYTARGDVTLNPARLLSNEAPYDIVSRMRASFNVLGPLVARTGSARVALPGGCDIGARPVDFHLKGLEAMGAEIHVDKGFVEAECDELKGANILMDYPSVTATEHLMATACLAPGRTVIENAATEPEVADVAAFLTKMGGRIWGAGTNTIEIEGVPEMGGCRHTVIPDRMEAGTFAVAAVITGGSVFLEGAIPEHMTATLLKLQQAGAVVDPLGIEGHPETYLAAPAPGEAPLLLDREPGTNGILVVGPRRPHAVDIKTTPHPGFPTDMQQPFGALLTVASGVSMVTETLFERRFKYASELQRLGADIRVEGQTAVFVGVDRLIGATVQAADLRGGAALVLAGLVAEGRTDVERAVHVDRGYSGLVPKLAGLGADIQRQKMEAPAEALAVAA